MHNRLWVFVVAVALAGSLAAATGLDDVDPSAAGAPLWGTYKSNLFFALRTRVAAPTVVGLAWAGADDWNLLGDLRHSCTEDGMDRYGWSEHDGRGYGRQTFVDRKHGLNLTVSFVSQADGSAIAVRVTATAHSARATSVPANLSLLVYASIEHPRASLRVDGPDSGELTVELSSPELEHTMTLVLPDVAAEAKPPVRRDLRRLRARSPAVPHFWVSAVARADVWRVRQLVMSELSRVATELWDAVGATGARTAAALAGLFATLPDTTEPEPTLAVVQRVVRLPITYEFALVSASRVAAAGSASVAAQQLLGEAFTRAATARSAAFDTSVRALVGSSAFDRSVAHAAAARAAVANLLGGVAFFHGDWLVATPAPVPPRAAPTAPGSRPAPPATGVAVAPAHSLLTCVPSRSFFPRGFLWDEGFHQLVVDAFDPALSRVIQRAWWALVDETGWVAREQILGEEARARVPREFQVQNREFANPPALLLSLRGVRARAEAARRDSPEREADLAHLRAVFPAASRQLNFLLRTQASSVPRSFRWHGRTENHTLTSGLDDYPRSLPSPFERHVDLHAWIAFAARELAAVAALVGHAERARELATEADALVTALVDAHWHEPSGLFVDRGPTSAAAPDALDYIVHSGYVALFPLALELLPVDSPAVGRLLDAISDPAQLWSKHGLRSLSRADPLFGTNENYWRGPIWININYLVCSALHRTYAARDGPYRVRAREVYVALRNALVTTVVREHHRTGFFWEQYSPDTGRGLRTHPFAGWTTLLVLLMAEHYP